MPYSKEWSTALETTLLDICKSAAMRLLVAKGMDGRFVPNDIWHGITSAAVIIADITDGNPNVAYEIGLADVLGKEVLLCQGDKVPRLSRAAIDLLREHYEGLHCTSRRVNRAAKEGP